MLKVIDKGKRQYDILIDDEKIVSLDIIFSSVSNKFNIITEFLEDCSKKLGSDFDNWIKQLFLDYLNTSDYKQELTDKLQNIQTLYLNNNEYDKILKDLQSINLKEDLINYDLIKSKIENFKNLLNDIINNHENIDNSLIEKEFNDLITFINNHNQEVLIENVDKIIYFCNKYIDSLNINFDDYINTKKRSKTSIFFNAKEIETLIKTTYYLKIYALFNEDKNLKLNYFSHKIVYNKLISQLSENIISKIFNIVTSKINRYHTTDKYMWEYIRINFCKSTDFHIMHIFNWIMNQILLLCKAEQNPITFLTSVIDNAIQWILKNTYNTTSTYTDNITTEDINYISGKDRLMNYAYDDTLSKLISISDKIMTEKINLELDTYRETIKKLKHISLTSKYITFPLLTKILEIPYRHFSTLPCDHCFRLNFLLFYIISEKFKKKYPTITKILLCYHIPKNNKKTTYVLENLEEFHNHFGHFLTTKNRSYLKKIISDIINKFNQSNFYSFKNPGFKVNLDQNFIKHLESDLIDFYCTYFEDYNLLIKELQEKIEILI